jgi:hypothetical protein
MTPAGLFVEVARLIGLLNDAHSWAAVDDDSRLFSRAVLLRFWKFEDGLYIRAAAPEFSDCVGARILSVGGLPIDEALARIMDIQPGANSMIALKTAQIFLEIPEFLQAIGLAANADELSLDLQPANGARRIITVPAVRYKNLGEVFDAANGFATPEGWIESPGTSVLWLHRRKEAFWFECLPDHRTIYAQINQSFEDPENPYQAKRNRFGEFLDRLFASIKADSIDRLIIDLRHNPGGEEPLWQPLDHRLIRAEKINVPGRLFIITGRLTESAPVAWAAKIEGETKALFVGEETASPPNFYNDPAGRLRETFRIPGSYVNYRIARQLEIWSVPSDLREGILPDIPAPLAYADFVQGRDPALEAISKIDPGTAASFFLTRSGIDTTDREWQHYRRKSQDAARHNTY